MVQLVQLWTVKLLAGASGGDVTIDLSSYSVDAHAEFYVEADNGDKFASGNNLWATKGAETNITRDYGNPLNNAYFVVKNPGNVTIHLKVNGDVALIKVKSAPESGGGGGDTPSEVPKMYVYGDFNGHVNWDNNVVADTKDYEMTFDHAEGDWYFYTYELNANASGTHYMRFNFEGYIWGAPDSNTDVELDTSESSTWRGNTDAAFKVTNPSSKTLLWAKGYKKEGNDPDVKAWISSTTVDITVSNASEADLAIFEVTSGGTTIDMGEHKNLYEGATATVNIKMSSASDKAPTKALVGSTDIDLTHDTTTDVYTGTFTVPNADAIVSVVLQEVQFYTVSYSADGFGSVSATVNDSPIMSGTTVKEGTSVVFTATPKNSTYYEFTKWSGDNTSNDNPLTVTVNANTTVKANFEPTKGTANTKYYFHWGYSTSDNVDVGLWEDQSGKSTTPVAVKLKNGHMYGYIDNVSTTGYYFYSLNYDTQKYNSWFYEGGGTAHDPETVTTTQFPGSFTLYNNKNWGGDWSGHSVRRYGVLHVTDSNVKGLIIDLGKYDPSNDSNVAYDVVYDVIPVFDTVNGIAVYAKNGTLRDQYMDVFASHAATTVSVTHNGSATAGVQQNKFQTALAQPGDTVTMTTTLDSTFNANYYVKAFSINGVVPQEELFKESDGTGDNGNTFSYTYTIPANFTESFIEITPVYYLRANNTLNATTTMFYIENYDQEVEDSGWGNTLFVYPFYTARGTTDVYGQDNAFGGYPGQPVIFHKGRRFVQIPTSIKLTTAESNNCGGKYAINDQATIKGVTMNNGYWDTVHRDYVSEVYFNHQTYDYDDFYMIYRETTDRTKEGYTGTADQITFSFKLRNASDNFSTSADEDSNKPNTQSSDANGKASYGDINNTDTVFTNGWEDLKDYRGNKVDIFGNVLEGDALNAAPLYVISDGYIATHSGYYATNWAVYKTDRTFITNISPSALILSNSGRFDLTTKYPNITTPKENYPTQKTLSDYKNAYNTLNNANYINRPVKISYEKSIINSAYENGDRLDGRWTFSYNGALIESNIRIDYSNDGGTTWTTDTWKSEGSNVGATTGCSAYFTNTDVDIYGKTTTAGIDIRSNPEDTFNFTAQGSGSYIFNGWWLLRDGIMTRISENDVLSSSTQRNSSDTYVAKFVQAPSGYLTVRHTVAESSVGSGTTYVKIVAKKTGLSNVVLTNPSGDGFVETEFAIDPAYINYKSGYTFDITLKTVPNAYNTFSAFSADGKNDTAAYWNGSASTDANGVATVTITNVSVDSLFAVQNGLPVQSMKTLDYYSTLTQQTINYVINYNFESRYYGNKTWQVTGTFTGEQVGVYVDSNDDIVPSFIDSKKPHESDFLKSITWNTSSAATDKSTSENTVTFTANVSSTKSQQLPVYLTVTLPYEYEYEYDNEQETVTKYFTPKLTDGEPTITDTEDITLEAVYGEQYYYFEGSKKIERIITAIDKYNVTESGAQKQMVFKYWKISNKQNALVTKIYDRDLKIMAYGNYNAEPVYLEKGTQEEIAETARALAATSITYLETNRNQWNAPANGTYASKADRLYADFALKFDYQNKLFREIGNTETDPKIQTGMIIEVLGDLEAASNGIGKNTNLEYYRTKYANFGTDEDSITNLKKYVKGKSGYTGSDIASTNYSATNISGETAQTKISSVFVPLYTNKTDEIYTKPFTVDAANNQYNIDNRNGVHYTYGIANKNNNTLDELTNRNKIYRAYSYMIVDGEVIVSEVPTYFELYTEGSK